MTYRVSKQDNGLFTIHDVGIFVECERGGVKYDKAWLDDATAIAKAEENHGYRPPAFIRHNDIDTSKLFSKGDEEADGRLANFRRQKVRSRGAECEGIVVDLTDVTEETKNRVISHRLPGRSIEAILPATRRRIDGLALLGRTPPYHTLAQGSEPRDMALFHAHDGSAVSLFVELDGPESFMNPPAPGAPPMGAPAPAAPPAPAPAQPQASPEILAAFQALAKALGVPMGGGAPPAPAAPKPPAQAHMDAKPDEKALLEEQVALLKSQLELANAQFALASQGQEQAAEQLAASEHEKAILAEIDDLKTNGVSFSEPYVREQIAKFGLESFRTALKPLLNRAPLVPPSGVPANPLDRGAVAAFAAFEADADLKSFAALPDQEKKAALEAAKEYDAAAKAHGASFTDSNPRDRYIATEIKRFRAQG